MAQRSKLFEYCVIFNPKERHDTAGNDTTAPSKLLVLPTHILSVSDKEVAMQAARAIPTEYADKLDQVEIVVRPF